MPGPNVDISRLHPNHPMRRRVEREQQGPTPEQLAAQYSQQIDAWLDQEARKMGYRDIVSAVTYIEDSNPKFAAEAAAFKQWRSDVWSQATVVFDEVKAETRPVPANFAALQALLPPAPTFGS